MDIIIREALIRERTDLELRVQKITEILNEASNESLSVRDNEESKESCIVCGKQNLVLVGKICFTCSIPNLLEQDG